MLFCEVARNMRLKCHSMVGCIVQHILVLNLEKCQFLQDIGTDQVQLYRSLQFF